MMRRKNLRNLLSDVEKVEYAQHVADQNSRVLKQVKDDTIRDSTVYEDKASGEQRSLPNKFIRALGLAAAFELVDPTLDVVNSTNLN
jgi:hypothetical protein|tara:strand:- start:3303 stop:3563 length:261 start_codon:yes stop_codon:yes gene_type:complete